MASAKFIFYLTYLFFGKMAQMTDLKLSVHQERRFVSANVGDNVTLQCFYEDNEQTYVYWYKQHLGQKPRLISTFCSDDDKPGFCDEFKNDPRFTQDTGKNKNHLKISDLHISDSATYHCTGSFAGKFEFANSTLVSIKGSGLNVPAFVHQSESESVQPGDSVTLNCTVHTGTCDGEHSVYWFKNSEESHPGLIYTHGGRNDSCERKPDTQTHTCVYNLPMKNLNLSHAGTYYCAVASCGHILFGDGTKLDVEDKGDLLVLVYCLSGALTFTTILVVLLAFSVYKLKKGDSCQTTEHEARFSAPSTANAEAHRDADNLHYAALSVNLPNRPRRQRNNTKDDCVYSSVRQ